jgi:predicted PurR-regulated permease PerM
MFRSRRQPSQAEVALTITTPTYVRIILLIIATIVILAALKKAAPALLIIFTAFFLALALNAPVHWVAQHIPGKRRGSRAIATALSFLIVVVLLGVFLASLVPPLVNQTEQFIKKAPSIVSDARHQKGELGEFIRHYNLEDQIDKFSTELQSRLKNVGSTAVSTTATIGTSLFTTLTVLALTFMMLVEGPRWLRVAKELFPPEKRPAVERLSLNMYKVVKGYVNGQVTLATIAALALLPPLLILGIGYPIALMVIVFICGLIPMVGATIGAIILSLVSLFTSPLAAVIILAYYLLYQQIENYLIQPRIQANSTNLSPLLVFSAVVIGVSFGGLFGGLVAIPVMGCVRVLVLDILRTRRSLVESPAIQHELAEAKISAK